MGEDNLAKLITAKGPIHFICGGWQCQSMSLVGNYGGMEDNLFLPFHIARIVNFIQKRAISCSNLSFLEYLAWHHGQYPLMHKAAQVVELFLGAPVEIDAAGLVPLHIVCTTSALILHVKGASRSNAKGYFPDANLG